MGWLTPKRYEVKAWATPDAIRAGDVPAIATRYKGLDEAKRNAMAIVEGMQSRYVAVVYKDGQTLIGFEWKGKAKGAVMVLPNY